MSARRDAAHCESCCGKRWCQTCQPPTAAAFSTSSHGPGDCGLWGRIPGRSGRFVPNPAIGKRAAASCMAPSQSLKPSFIVGANPLQNGFVVSPCPTSDFSTADILRNHQKQRQKTLSCSRMAGLCSQSPKITLCLPHFSKFTLII